MPEQPYVKIAVIDSEIEARLLQAILEERGIEHDIRSYHDTAYDGLFQAQRGWGAVRGPEAVRAEIELILSDLRAGTAEVEMDETEDN